MGGEQRAVVGVQEVMQLERAQRGERCATSGAQTLPAHNRSQRQAHLVNNTGSK